MLDKPTVNDTQTFAGIIAVFEFTVSQISWAGEFRRASVFGFWRCSCS